MQRLAGPQRLQRRNAAPCQARAGYQSTARRPRVVAKQRRCVRRLGRKALTVRAGPVEIDDEDLMQHPDRMKWYEARFAAEDMPDWNAARFVSSQDVAPGLRSIRLQAEISRERVPLRNAYKAVGQRASVRVTGGETRTLMIASTPHALALQKDPLFRTKGDIFSEEIKAVKEMTSVMADLELLVSRQEAPEVYELTDEDAVEVGPFQGTGVDFRSSGMLAIYRYPTLVLFAEGMGIASAAALVESELLALKWRKAVHLYYKVPNEMSICYKDRFEAWAEAGVKVLTTTSSFQDAFDDDDTLTYEPETTAAIILTGGDEESEKAAREVCKEAEIELVVADSSEQDAVKYLDSAPKIFSKWVESKS